MKLNYRFQFFIFLALILSILLIFKSIDIGLKKYTLHDNIIAVPDLVGLSLTDVEDTLLKYNLDFEIIDSAAYNPSYARGSVLLHNPQKGCKVKPDRKIYLTINPLTVHYISFPELTNKSLRQSIRLLKNNAFRIGNLYYVEHFAKDVLRFAKLGDEKVNFNDSLPKFSVIDLYVGNGYQREVLVPNITGLTIKEVKQKLYNYSLNLGSIHFLDKKDSLNLIIYKQEPVFNQKVPLGTFISVFAKDTVIIN